MSRFRSAWWRRRSRPSCRRTLATARRARGIVHTAAAHIARSHAEGGDGAIHARHRQQELFVVVDAALGAAAAGRHPVQGSTAPVLQRRVGTKYWALFAHRAGAGIVGW